ncbi:MAG: phosphatidylglycerophosphatase A [Opitutaceae bacterium]|nr:phosphatidylglycerophosphatase A [Opitutaceae bacterium]
MNWSQPQWTRRLPSGLVVGLATLGPVGRMPFGPGTWGTLVGLVFFVAVLKWLPTAALLGIALLLCWAAVGICGEAEVRLRQTDPGCVILDEFSVVPLCFLGWPQLAAVVPHQWMVFALGFALFRLLDITKPLRHRCAAGFVRRLGCDGRRCGRRVAHLCVAPRRHRVLRGDVKKAGARQCAGCRAASLLTCRLRPGSPS